MKYPKMIIFDYGHTLLYEPDWNTDKGNCALMKYIVKNPNHCTLNDIKKGAELVFGKHIENVRKIGYDISGQVGNKVLYEYLGIEFSLSPLEMETVFWNGASMGAVMPDAEIMLDFLNQNGIRTAVISNLLWSGDALKERLDRLLPNNKFEFVMTSSDYFLRKPNKILFDIALQKSGLSAEEVWYCGDNPKADIEGASQSGIYPVWYDNDTGKEYKDYDLCKIPNCEHLHIHDWREMIEVLKKTMIGKTVTVTVDRPLGSCHPEHRDMYYSVNYGYIEGVFAPDGEEQDAYILGVDMPVEKFTGRIIAVIHRLDDVEDKWVVCPENIFFSKGEIMKRVEFQEKYFNIEIIM